MKNVLNVGEDKNWWKSWKITNSLETIDEGFLEMSQKACRRRFLQVRTCARKPWNAPKSNRFIFSPFRKRLFPFQNGLCAFFSRNAPFLKILKCPTSHLILNFIWFSSMCPHVEKSSFTCFWDISRNPPYDDKNFWWFSRWVTLCDQTNLNLFYEAALIKNTSEWYYVIITKLTQSHHSFKRS